jgi:glyoxylase-like metal-dependent hydrolase (beta-lactamase superfamily II)
MNKLNAEAIQYAGEIPEILDNSFHGFQRFTINEILEDNQVIEIGSDMSVQVIATPGHTRDHLSYFVREKGVLIASEASGCLDATGKIVPEFLADYESYLTSLKKLAVLDAQILCQGHRYVVTGRAEIRQFFEQSIEETERFKDRVIRLLQDEGGVTERVVMRIKAEIWDTNPGPKQPETPFLINLETKVKHLAGRFVNRNQGQALPAKRTF